MADEKPLLFVRQASGLTRAISTWPALFWGLGVSFLPWHYYLFTAIPTWFPGVNLPFIYFVGGAIVLLEVTAMALCYVAMPRSGSIYIPVSRAVSPMLGIMEATRSFITNPVQRGVTAFIAAGAIASMLSTVGRLAGDQGLINMGQALSANPWNLVALAIFFNFVGWVVNVLGPRIMARWVLFWGAGSFLTILLINGLLASASPDVVRARWDATFGAGAYDEVLRVAQAGGFTPPTISWEPTLAALLLPVSNTWPYTLMPVVGEVEKPRRNIPLSMMGGAAILMVVNTLTAFNYMRLFGTFGNAYAFVTSNPELAGQLTLTPVLPIDLSLFATVIAAGSLPLALLVAFGPQWGNFADVVVNENFTSRPLFAMAMDRMGPEIFARVHPRFHSPWVGSTYWFLVTLSTSILSGAYVETVSAIVFGITFVYGLARLFQHLAEIELPYTRPEIYRSGITIEIAGIPLMTILGAFSAGLFLYLLATLPANPVYSAAMIGVIYTLGAIIYFYYARKNMKRGISPRDIYAEIPPE